MIEHLKVILHDWLFVGHESDPLKFFQAITWLLIGIIAFKILYGIFACVVWLLKFTFKSKVKTTGNIELNEQMALILQYGNIPPGYTVYLYGIKRSLGDSSTQSLAVYLKESTFWFTYAEANSSIGFQETVQVLATTRELADKIVQTKIS